MNGMIKVWLITKFHKKFLMGSMDKEKMKLHFNHYKKTDLGENEILIQVPLDVYNYYAKS